MKKVLYTLTLLALSNCAAYDYKYRADYDYAIKTTKINNQAQDLPEEASLSFEDDWFKVSFLPDTEGVYLLLNNVNSETLHVVWDQSVIVHDQRALKVFHNGVKLINVSESLPNSVIPPGAFLEDKVSPAAYLAYSPPTDYSVGGWRQQRLIKEQYTRSPESDYPKFKATVEALNNTDLYGLMLSVIKGNEIREYYFDFKIASARVSEINLPSH